MNALVLSLLLLAAYASNDVQFETNPVRQITQARDRGIPDVKPDDVQNVLTDTDIVETQARPLFSASRRPFVAKVASLDNPDASTIAAEPQPITAPRRIRLLGVNIFDGDFTALVQNQESAEVRWIKKGQEFDGWVLTAADTESAHFACVSKISSDCEYEVELYAVRSAE